MTAEAPARIARCASTFGFVEVAGSVAKARRAISSNANANNVERGGTGSSPFETL